MKVLAINGGPRNRGNSAIMLNELKKVLDRFRSFVNVQLKENGLIYTLWTVWNKKFVLLMSQGASDEADAKPAIELFEFIINFIHLIIFLTCLLNYHSNI